MNRSTKQKNKHLIRTTIALAIPFAAPAHAYLITPESQYAFSGSASVTDSSQTSGANSNNGAAVGNNISIGQFDPGLGVLVRATQKLDSSRTMTLTGTGTGNGTATGAGATGTAKFEAPGVSANYSAVNAPNGSCSANPACNYSSASLPKATNGSYAVAGVNLDDYVGNGTVSASFSAPTLSVTSTGSKPATQATATESWSGTVTTQYEYLLHALPSFDNNQPLAVLSLNFGNVMQNAIVDPLTFSIFNFGDANRVALDLDANTSSGDTSALTTDAYFFQNLLQGSQFDFSAYLDSSTLGSYAASYVFSFSDEDFGAAASRNNNMLLTLNLSGNVLSTPLRIASFANVASVPEPASLALLTVGLFSLVWHSRKQVRPVGQIA